MRPRLEDGSGQHLVNGCLLDSENYVGGFEGRVNMCTSFDIIRDTECPSFAILNKHVHAGGPNEMVDGIWGQRGAAFPDS